MSFKSTRALACVIACGLFTTGLARPTPSIVPVAACEAPDASVSADVSTGRNVALGAADPHWRLISAADASVPKGPAHATKLGDWTAPIVTPGAHWIEPAWPSNATSYQPAPAGSYIYELKFNLPADPYLYDSISLSGTVAVDNSVRVILNGVDIGGCTVTVDPWNACMITNTPIGSSNWADFRQGINVLQLRVVNGPALVHSGVLFQAAVAAKCSKCVSPRPRGGEAHGPKAG